MNYSIYTSLNMLLAIDIGNTNIVLGIFDNDKIIKTWRLETDQEKTLEEYKTSINRFIEVKITGVIIGSVVPSLNQLFSQLIKELFSIEPLFVSPQLKLPIKLSVDNPQEVGTDIIANTVAAHKSYPGSIILIDAGTATTFNIIVDETYTGTIIAPGIHAMAKSLSNSGAQLPDIEIKKTNSLIGTNTIDCMQSGIFFGYVAMVEGLLGKLKHKYPGATIISAGGIMNVIQSELSDNITFKPNLTLEGLYIIYLLNTK